MKTQNVTGAPTWSSSSVLDHRSLPPGFESQRGHIWRLFHLWLRFITVGGRSAHLAYHVHKRRRKIPIIIIIIINQNVTTSGLIISHLYQIISICIYRKISSTADSSRLSSCLTKRGLGTYSGRPIFLEHRSLICYGAPSQPAAIGQHPTRSKWSCCRCKDLEAQMAENGMVGWSLWKRAIQWIPSHQQ